MLLIDCPFCGPRPEIEFTHGGEAHLVRAAKPTELDDQAWTDFLYMRTNTKGPYAERWRHAHGCGRFFNAVRDTTTDHFLATYRSGEPQPTFGANAQGDQRAMPPDAAVAALPAVATRAAPENTE